MHAEAAWADLARAMSAFEHPSWGLLFQMELEPICAGPLPACQFTAETIFTVEQVLPALPAVQMPSIRPRASAAQKVGGVLALTISHGSRPTFRNRCGRWLEK